MRGDEYNHNHFNETQDSVAVSTETQSATDLATA